MTKKEAQRLASKHKLFSLSNLNSSTILPTSPFFGEQCTLPHFLKNKQNSNPHPFCKVEEIQLWLIKTTSFKYLLLKIDPVIIKTLNFRFENVYLLNFQKILMIKVSEYPYKMKILKTTFSWFTILLFEYNERKMGFLD